MLGLALAASPAMARDSAADALAGHRAEQRQWQGETDPLRRPLFLDPVEIESPVVGLPCDHRPQAGAGQGFVVLFESLETPPRRVRFFLAPGQGGDLAIVRNLGREFARSRLGALEIREIGARTFLWCR